MELTTLGRDAAAVAASSSHALVDDVAARIRAKIMTGEIPIGAQLRQAELAESFDVSRTPVREALRQLQSTGLIEVVPNRGAIVRVPVPWEVREAYEVRAELESLAAARSVPRITEDTIAAMRKANSEAHERMRTLAQGDPVDSDGSGGGHELFHLLLREASGNVRLARAITEITENFPRNVSTLVLVGDARQRDENFHEHTRILDAIEAGDVDKASEEMRSHVLSAGEHLAHWYERRLPATLRG